MDDKRNGATVDVLEGPFLAGFREAVPSSGVGSTAPSIDRVLERRGFGIDRRIIWKTFKSL